MESAERFERPQTALLSIRESFDPDSSLTTERLEHSLKQ
jgi:hypothetical protein